MSKNLNSRCKPVRMAKAVRQGMCALATIKAERIVAARQIFGHMPANNCDPMEAPDL